MKRKTSNPQRRARTALRSAALVAAAALLLTPALPPTAPRLVPSASPLVGIAASLAKWTLPLAGLVWIAALLVAIVRRRWFCRWLCPVGLMTECTGRLSPLSPARSKPVPPLGIGLAALSVSAAAIGFPLFLWLDPLALFAAAVGLVADPASAGRQAAAGLLAGILVLSFLLPGAWCLKLCPLGATQELLAGAGRAFRRRPNNHTDDELIAEPLSRRSLLATGVGIACAAAGVPLGLAARAHGEGEAAAVLRPPGAARRGQFGHLCLRCGNCGRACPSQIIATRWTYHSWSDWLTPQVAFDHDYCRKECVACIEACPSGALSAAPGDFSKPPIGLASVLMDRCLLALGRECRTMCLDSCPYEAISLHPWTWDDDRRYPVIAAEKCPGCGACQVACTPMDAIIIKATR